MVTFLHTADWQIGMKGGALGPEAAAKVAEARLSAIDRLLALAAERGVDFVVAAGDLFEDNRLDEDLVAALAAIIRDHPDTPIYAIPGNHDVVGPGSPWRTSALSTIEHLTCLDTSDPIDVTTKTDGSKVTIFPCPVLTRYAYGDALESIPDAPAKPDLIRIGLAHGHISTITFGADHEDIKLPLAPEHVTRAGLDYLALGHWHSVKLERAPGQSDPRIAYSGTPEQSRFEEVDPGKVLVVTIDAPTAPPKIEPVQIGTLRWHRLEHAFTGDTSLDSLTSALATGEAKDADLLALRITGELPASLDPAYQALLEATRTDEQYAHFRVKDRGLRFVADIEALSEATKLRDPILAKVRQSLATQLDGATDQDGEAIREALRLLLQFHAEELGDEQDDDQNDDQEAQP